MKHIVKMRQDARRLRDFGVLAESVGTFNVTGGSNPSHPHRVTLWSNAGRKRSWAIIPEGMYLGPNNEITSDAFTLAFGAEPIVIAKHPIDDRGPNLGRIVAGDQVDVVLGDGTLFESYVLNEYTWGRGWTFTRTSDLPRDGETA